MDAYKKSRYFFKDKDSKGGKIHSGPPWDYDWAWKNIWDCHMFTNTDGSGWAYRVNECEVWPTPPAYVSRLLEDEYFANNLKHKYESLRATVLSTENLYAYIDSVTNCLSNAQLRHYSRWDILGENVGAPEVDYIPTTFNGQIGKIKDWIATRLNWLDANMPGNASGPMAMAINKGVSLRIFPNPASEQVYIESDQTIRGMWILNLSGAEIMRIENADVFSMRVSLSSFSPGLYLVRIKLENGNMISEKLLIQ